MIDTVAISEVTPVKKPKRHLGNKSAYLALGIVVLILLSGFWPHSKEVMADTAEETPKKEENYTLSQNLALIEQMKNKVEQAVEEKIGGAPRPTHPPKLKHTAGLSKEVAARMNAPTTFFNASAQTADTNGGNASKGNNAYFSGNGADSQFMNQQNDITSVSARQLPHPYETVPAGEMIAATLETAVNPELPGMVRAVIERDIYSLEGQNCLIPRGSVLIGQFNSSIVEGQSRILVVWNRVQLSNGIIVTLNSPGTDSIGRAGLSADYIDRHFIERFASSALFSVLGAVASNTGVDGQDQYNSKAQYRMMMANSMQQASSQSLQANASRRDTLQTNQGSKITVFVAHDLDFHGVMRTSQRSLWK